MFVHKNKTVLFILVSFLLYFSRQGLGQTKDSVSLKQGSWALQFGIGSNFTLTSFQGTTLGAKYQLSDENAIRGGITLNGNTNSGSTSYSGSVADSDAGTVSGSTSSKSANISFVLQYIWYMNPKGNVHLYAGVGPLVSCNYYDNAYNSSSLNITNNVGYWTTAQYEDKSTQWGVGGAAVFGVEWFAFSWLSLHADYNENIQYQWRSTSSNRSENSTLNTSPYPYSNNTSSSTKGLALNSGGVSFGLNIYL
jgi:hypothetical protein